MTPERQHKIAQVLKRRQPDLSLIFENIEDPHNISAVIRTCDAVGVQDIYIANTLTGAPVELGWKSSRSASTWVTIHQFDNIAACLEEVRTKYENIFATHLGEKAYSLYELDLTASVALVFGNERKGVSPEMLGLCDGNFIVPQVGMIHSLNVSVACAVSLYEAYRQRSAKGYYDQQRLPQDRFDELTVKWGKK
ncbi:MAG TPA: RNA methyltransferase [Flavipsychrobacter sp.]|nr:RNA methyltransferase [Flavipsychrobacter sp.]